MKVLIISFLSLSLFIGCKKKVVTHKTCNIAVKHSIDGTPSWLVRRLTEKLEDYGYNIVESSEQDNLIASANIYHIAEKKYGGTSCNTHRAYAKISFKLNGIKQTRREKSFEYTDIDPCLEGESKELVTRSIYDNLNKIMDQSLPVCEIRY